MKIHSSTNKSPQRGRHLYRRAPFCVIAPIQSANYDLGVIAEDMWTGKKYALFNNPQPIAEPPTENWKGNDLPEKVRAASARGLTPGKRPVVLLNAWVEGFKFNSADCHLVPGSVFIYENLIYDKNVPDFQHEGVQYPCVFGSFLRAITFESSMDRRQCHIGYAIVQEWFTSDGRTIPTYYHLGLNEGIRRAGNAAEMERFIREFWANGSQAFLFRLVKPLPDDTIQVLYGDLIDAYNYKEGSSRPPENPDLAVWLAFRRICYSAHLTEEAFRTQAWDTLGMYLEFVPLRVFPVSINTKVHQRYLTDLILDNRYFVHRETTEDGTFGAQNELYATPVLIGVTADGWLQSCEAIGSSRSEGFDPDIYDGSVQLKTGFDSAYKSAYRPSDGTPLYKLLAGNGLALMELPLSGAWKAFCESWTATPAPLTQMEGAGNVALPAGDWIGDDIPF